MKKIIFLLLTSIMVVSLVSCGSNGETSASDNTTEGSNVTGTITLQAGHVLTEDSPYHLALLKWSEEVYEKTEGRIQIDVFANSTLGNEREMIEALMKKKYEYESLMQEINERDEYFVQQKNENNEKKQKEDNKSKENRVSEEDNVNIEKEEESFQEILGKIYSKAEVCLAFLNDKNKCKAELRSMKQMIKEYISSFEKE